MCLSTAVALGHYLKLLLGDFRWSRLIDRTFPPKNPGQALVKFLGLRLQAHFLDQRGEHRRYHRGSPVTDVFQGAAQSRSNLLGFADSLAVSVSGLGQFSEVWWRVEQASVVIAGSGGYAIGVSASQTSGTGAVGTVDENYRQKWCAVVAGGQQGGQGCTEHEVAGAR